MFFARLINSTVLKALGDLPGRARYPCRIHLSEGIYNENEKFIKLHGRIYNRCTEYRGSGILLIDERTGRREEREREKERRYFDVEITIAYPSSIPIVTYYYSETTTRKSFLAAVSNF